jgi:hypothetical protein
MSGSIARLLVGVVGFAVVVTGCQSPAVPKESDHGDEVIDKAVAAGADIPPDKRSLVARMLSLSEKDLIRGLRTFAELSGGRYPTRLDTKTTVKEADGLGSSLREMSESEKKQKMQDIFFASAFYEKLGRENRDVVYHGDVVGADDTERILLRWRIARDDYRVVHADLRCESVTHVQLAALEVGPTE